MKLDFKQARDAFEAYLDEYDREDEKIKLKIVHTYGVVKSAREIGKRMHLNEEDQQLAELIALLHDIGRFEQLRLCGRGCFPLPVGSVFLSGRCGQGKQKRREKFPILLKI